VKYELISLKIGRNVLENPLTNMYIKCPLHVKYVLALPWETIGETQFGAKCYAG